MSSPAASVGDDVQLTTRQLFDALSNDERATVVTPNRRLAAYLKEQFDDLRREAGHTAWATPDILPFSTFLERTYRAVSLRGETNPQPQLLDINQSQLLWEQVVSDSDVASHLLSVTQTARQAAAAWSVAQAWELLPSMRQATLFEDAAVFLGWSQRFQARCSELNVVDTAVVSNVLAKGMQEDPSGWIAVLPRQLFTAGFDIVAPQQQHFFTVCKTLRISVHKVQSSIEHANTHCRRVEFATEDEELRGCAAWARQCLLTNPLQRIAIVLPDLRAKRSGIARALTDALQPGHRAGAARPPDGGARGFNISLGLALNDYALVHDALSLIAFSHRRAVPFAEASALLRSPFIAGAVSEAGPRARLDAALRDVLGVEVSLFGLQRKLKLASEAPVAHAVAGCQALLATIDRVAAVESPSASVSATAKGGARKSMPRNWSRHFGQLLLAWGFPGDEKLDSVDYQVLEKFRDALSALSMLDAVQPRMRGNEALNHLRRIVADTVFQPEAPQSAPIQVLGILESAGQTFDALWVMGLSEDAWPLATRPNSFIPAILQRAAGVPEASAAASLALDQRITQGWKKCASEVVFSHGKTASDSKASEQPRKASALIRDVELTVLSALIAEGESTDYAQALLSIGQCEPIVEAPLPALRATTKISGGSSVLRDQAACPFRAFARHRLGARALGVPDEGLDAAERGILLHRVLSLVWKRLKTHAQLMAMDETALSEFVGAMVHQAIDEAYATGMEMLTGRFAEIERGRLRRLVVEWLNYEREREPFEVLACEQASDVTVAGLAMHLRLDRLDRLADGTVALIDYKTGMARVTDWLGPRMDEPQLPLYCHASGQPISVLAFARVKRGARRKVFGFEGVSAVENLLPDVGPIESKSGMEKQGYVSWDILRAEWEDSINSLATNVINGDVEVDPKNGNLTCAQCDLQSVCRISELAGSSGFDDENAADGANAKAVDD